MEMSKTDNIVLMLADEGITGPRADAVCWEIVRQHSPGTVRIVEILVDRGYTPDAIGAELRQRAGKRADEAHIANCMAVARHLVRVKLRVKRVLG